jgi:hypothetical protein
LLQAARAISKSAASRIVEILERMKISFVERQMGVNRATVGDWAHELVCVAAANRLTAVWALQKRNNRFMQTRFALTKSRIIVSLQSPSFHHSRHFKKLG